MPTVAARSPGITFETRPPATSAGLPRMDVAAFVGLAASGPLDLPVPVDSIAEFHEIFGQDLRVGSDPDSNAPVYAELAPAVRRFFRAGGQRCWIVRVAAGGATNRFPLPGILALASDGSITGTHLAARSPGSWSDPLRLNASLAERAVPVRWVPGASPGAAVASVAGVRRGDVVRVTLSRGRHLVGFVPVPDRREPDHPAGAAAVDLAAPSVWFWHVTRRLAGLGPAVPGGRPCEAALLAPTSDGLDVVTPLPAARCGWTGETLVVEADPPMPPLLRAGMWLRIRCQPAGPVPLVEIHALVRDVDLRRRIGQTSRVRIETADLWRTVAAADASLDVASGVAGVHAHVVTVTLWVRGHEGVASVGDLGLAEPHGRQLADLPDDQRVFQAAPDGTAGATEPLCAATRSPRFPLASPYRRVRDSSSAAPDRPALFIPLGLALLPNEARHQAAVPRLDSVLERDGVTRLDRASFLEPELAQAGAASLLDRAFHLQYLAGAGPVPAALRGLHALLGTDEPSMIAVPDAAHLPAAPRLRARGWLHAPRDVSVRATADGRAAILEWTGPGGATTFRVERATDPLFTRDVTVVPPLPGEEAARHRVDDGVGHEGAPLRYFFRVRARGSAGRIGPWSTTVWITLPREDFGVCAELQLAAPRLTLDDQGDTNLLRWTAPVASDGAYALEASQDPSFAVAEELYRGPDRRFSVWDVTTRLAAQRGTGRQVEEIVVADLFFRVRAVIDGRESPWSATVRHPGSGGQSNATSAAIAATPADIVAIHAALLRLCAARGDAHAILSLPATWRVTEANEHVRDLTAAVASPAEDEGQLERILSFGAAWHPWPLIREAAGTGGSAFFAVAPDGIVAGTIAARTRAGGAWLSSTNRVLPDVLQLTPELDATEVQALSPRLNLLHSTPRGFVAASAATLVGAGGGPRAVRELGVRRLLMLIRRLAVREGAAFAFLSHDGYLRRLVQRTFEGVLGDLFARGALAGARPEEAFQVVVDDTVNPPGSVESGRLIVELWVAPSHPLSFLTVRLVQLGGQLLAQEN